MNGAKGVRGLVSNFIQKYKKGFSGMSSFEIVGTRDLSKWPRLLVSGTDVTAEQADDILVRTTYLSAMMCTNDREWRNELVRLWGLDLDRFGQPSRESCEAARDRYGLLNLSYLYNARSASSWIGGPHGWCDWDGRIGTAHYNVGKWPTTGDITEEATTIAAAFPFLDMVVQLVPDEAEHTRHPVAQWTVRDGRAHYQDLPDGTDPVVTPVDLSADAILGALTLLLGGERGVHPARLEQALARTAARIREGQA